MSSDQEQNPGTSERLAREEEDASVAEVTEGVGDDPLADAAQDYVRDATIEADERDAMQEASTEAREERGGIGTTTDTGGVRRLSDDQFEPEGRGIDDNVLREPYGRMATSDDVARQFEELLMSLQEWAEQNGSRAARELAFDFESLYERFGAATEETDLERSEHRGGFDSP